MLHSDIKKGKNDGNAFILGEGEGAKIKREQKEEQ